MMMIEALRLLKNHVKEEIIIVENEITLFIIFCFIRSTSAEKKHAKI